MNWHNFLKSIPNLQKKVNVHYFDLHSCRSATLYFPLVISTYCHFLYPIQITVYVHRRRDGVEAQQLSIYAAYICGFFYLLAYQKRNDDIRILWIAISQINGKQYFTISHTPQLQPRNKQMHVLCWCKCLGLQEMVGGQNSRGKRLPLARHQHRL